MINVAPDKNNFLQVLGIVKDDVLIELILESFQGVIIMKQSIDLTNDLTERPVKDSRYDESYLLIKKTICEMQSNPVAFDHDDYQDAKEKLIEIGDQVQLDEYRRLIEMLKRAEFIRKETDLSYLEHLIGSNDTTDSEREWMKREVALLNAELYWARGESMDETLYNN